MMEQNFKNLRLLFGYHNNIIALHKATRGSLLSMCLLDYPFDHDTRAEVISSKALISTN